MTLKAPPTCAFACFNAMGGVGGCFLSFRFRASSFCWKTIACRTSRRRLPNLSGYLYRTFRALNAFFALFPPNALTNSSSDSLSSNMCRRNVSVNHSRIALSPLASRTFSRHRSVPRFISSMFSIPDCMPRPELGEGRIRPIPNMEHWCVGIGQVQEHCSIFSLQNRHFMSLFDLTDW